MKPSFSIGARNGLLEQKHLDALGPAIWLYLWFLDKQPKNTDKVLGGQPVTYQMFVASFPKLPRITYVRWLAIVESGGYINLLRTPRGYVVTINKPKKWVVGDVSKTIHQKQSDVSKMSRDVSKTIHAEDVSKTEHPIKRNSLNKQKETIRPLASKSPEHEEISKLFYQAAKSLELPVLNHNTLRVKIKQMTTEVDHDKLKGYLKFMRDRYAGLNIDFKPQINSALDLYSKRVQVENSVKMAIKEKQENKVFRI